MKRIREKHLFKYMKMILVINCGREREREREREFSDIWDQNSEYFITFVYLVQLLNMTMTYQLRKIILSQPKTTKCIFLIHLLPPNQFVLFLLDRRTATVYIS